LDRRRTRWFDSSVPVDLVSATETSTAATQPRYFHAQSRIGSDFVLTRFFFTRTGIHPDQVRAGFRSKTLLIINSA
jgi:hypothetical protein